MASNAEQQAKQAADKFREDHGLGVQPLGDLVELIEHTVGCDVAVLDADEGEHGLTMRDPLRGKVFIGVARSTTPMRQRSTLGHELGHLLFEDWAEGIDYGKRSFEEIRADAFARHLLTPIEGVRELLGTRDSASESDLSALVQRFLVSPPIAAIALREAGYIDADRSQEWMKFRTPLLATRYGWSDHYAALQADSNRLRSPQALVARAIAGYEEGVVSAQMIATLRGVDVAVLVDELDAAGITPRHHDVVDVGADSLPDVEVDLSGLEDEGTAS